jgi:thioredoxin reductase (NADPH)
MEPEYHDILIIGAGPAGISAGVEAAKRKLDCLILEKGDVLETIKKLYHKGKRVDQDYRGIRIDQKGHVKFQTETKEEFIAHLEDEASHHHLNINKNEAAEKIERQDGQFVVYTTKKSYKCKYLVLAIGMFSKPAKIPVEVAPEAKDKVLTNLGRQDQKNMKILVVGGGNNAAEFAIFLQKNNQVTISYRRPEFFRLNEVNSKAVKELVAKGKLKIIFESNVKKIEAKNGKALVYLETKSRVEQLLFDQVIFGFGGATAKELLEEAGVEFEDNQPKLTENNEAVNTKNLFVIGDAAHKDEATIAKAFNDGFEVINFISS